MIPTFNTKNYNEVTCAKMVIDCFNDFRARITIGRGQAVVRHHVFYETGDVCYAKPERPDGLVWYLVVANDNEGTVALAGDTYLGMLLAGDAVPGLDKPTTFDIYYTLFNPSTGEMQHPSDEEVKEAFGNEPPAVVLFVVC